MGEGQQKATILTACRNTVQRCFMVTGVLLRTTVRVGAGGWCCVWRLMEAG